MKTWVLVGYKDNGDAELIGEPGPFEPLDKACREIVDNGGKVGKGKAAKSFLKVELGALKGKIKKCK
jgi:hypothetical protein